MSARPWRLVRREELTGRERAAMRGLLERHFDGVTPTSFEADLEAKNWVVLLEEPGARDGVRPEAGHTRSDEPTLYGFTTLRVEEVEHAGEVLGLVYSGDTIVDPGAWSKSVLSRAWIHSVLELGRSLPRARRLYWLLITSGFRTYRFLPVFYREFFPRHDAPTPPATQAMIDAFAAHLFGARYSPAEGVVHLDVPQVLRPHLSEVPEGREQNPHVRFFLQRNPGHVRGDELVCLTEVSLGNLTPAGRRAAR